MIVTVSFAWFSEMLIQPPLWGWRASGKHVVKDKGLCAVSLLADMQGQECLAIAESIYWVQEKGREFGAVKSSVSPDLLGFIGFMTSSL